MINPYSPPEFISHHAADRTVSTINGLLIGVGIGLQMCDIIDLNPSDFTPMYGWLTAIVVFGLVGTTWGYFRKDHFAWRWLILLGFMALTCGLTTALTTCSQSPINVYTMAMICAAFCYMLFGTIIAIQATKQHSPERPSSRESTT